MAVQVGYIKLKGTFGGICFYKLYEQYYARQKSSLTGKRVKRDPAFKTTMLYATLLANASKIASMIYQRLPQEQKSRKKYQQLTGRIIHMLKDGMSSEEIIESLTRTANS